MATNDNFYSQLVAWMKIILPLAALALLSTLFLISRHVDPTKSIPIAEIDLAQRAQDQGVTNASFAGVTTGGDEVMVTALTARPTSEDPRLIEAEDVTAELRLISGGLVEVVSDRGNMHQTELTATLIDNVMVTTTTGYKIRTEQLNTRVDELFAESPGPITGTGPLGDLDAGRMILNSDPNSGNAHLLFTDGVKLVYMPQPSEDD